MVFAAYKKFGLIPGFNPSLQFIKPGPSCASSSDYEMALKDKLLAKCPSCFTKENTSAFFAFVYKHERPQIRQNIEESVPIWKQTFLDFIDTDIFT